MSESRRDKLQEFVNWSAAHITGDEKGQAQIFLDHLFKAFAQPGSLDVGGSPEMRVKKSSEDGGGTSFADYVWKPVVLIEMKKRGVDLRKHYRQAFDYWTRLVPNRPRYVVLCNFDEFHVYDFDRQVDDPVDIVLLKDLPDRWGPLAFLFPTKESPTFGNDREKVTREAADRLATCYTKFEVRKVDPDLRQRFILQCLVTLFAEDIGLLDRYTFSKLLEECKKTADSYDLLGGLFEAMNRPGGNPGGRYKGVRYFNGGIFAQAARVELYDDELNQLRQAATSDWSKVSPEIFGTLFEHSMGKENRHAFGAHFTSQIDILKIVKPTIVDPWTAAINAARSGDKLINLLERLTTLRVLDPACGSGNFLYVAYREMKRLETSIRQRLAIDFPKTPATLVHVNARQFFGLDINLFAVELAKVTMMLGRKLAIDELHISDEADLPLDNLDANFQCVDALISHFPPKSPSPGTPGERGGEGSSWIQTPWPPADIIIGNPPFLGAKRLKPEHGADYVNAVRKLYPEVPGMADYRVYWIRRAADHLPPCTKADPFAGRAGLVGTQNIRNNQSRVGGLDHVVETSTIIDAVENQPWSGEANVSVSIANWVKSKDEQLLSKKRCLRQKLIPDLGGKREKKKGVRADKTYELTSRDVALINSALSDQVDLGTTAELSCCKSPQKCFQGVVTGYKGYVLTLKQRGELINRTSSLSIVVRPYMVGRDLVSGEGGPSRAIIDFADRDMLSSMKFTDAFNLLKDRVLPAVRRMAERAKKTDMAEARADHLQRWWQLWNVRVAMRKAFAPLSRFIALSRVSKRPIFCFVSPTIVPDGKLQTFAFEDDYSFGILSSDQHWRWFFAKCAKLTERLSYSPRSVFNTFPWPQSPTKSQITAVAAAGREVRRVREEALKIIPGGLRAVYRTLELPGEHPLKDAHAVLDAAVLAAYGFSAKEDLLKQLLDLNRAVAAREKGKLPVTAPGVPPSYGDPKPLITDDCIRPANPE